MELSIPGILLVAAVISIAYCVVPFTVFSMNKKLDRLIALLEQQNAELRKL